MRGRERAVGSPRRLAAGSESLKRTVPGGDDLDPAADAACGETPIRRRRTRRNARLVDPDALERGQREPLRPTAVVGEDELAADTELRELGDELLAVGERLRLRIRCVAAAADRVDCRDRDDCRERRDRDCLELPYEAASTGAAAWSCSPKRARGTNWPIPGFPTTSPPSTITLPRSSTVSTSPTTSVPS